MEKYNYVTGFIFIILGITLLISGVKLYKDATIILIPILLALIGF